MCRTGRRLGLWKKNFFRRIIIGSHWIYCRQSESPEDNLEGQWLPGVV